MLATRAERIAASALWICVAACVGTIAWNARRGLDITDSGFYLLSARHPDEVMATVTSFYRYTAPVFAALGYDVGWFRVAGLALMLAAGLVLAVGVQRFRAARAGPVVPGSAPLIVLGVLLQYAWCLPTPGYNLLNAAAVAMSAGLLLIAASLPSPQRPAAAVALPALVGALVAVSLFCKVTTGLCLVVLYAVAPWVLDMKAGRWRALMAMGLGGIVWSAMHFCLFETPVFWWMSWQRGLGFAAALGSGHGGGLLFKYLHEAGTVTATAARRFWLIGLPLLFAAWWSLRRRADRLPHPAVLPIAMIVVAVIVAWRGYFGDLHLGGDGNLRRVPAVYVAVLVMTLAGLGIARAGTDRYGWLLAAWLIALTGAGVAGTAVTMSLSLMLYFGPALAAICVLLSCLAATHARIAALAVAGAFATSQIVSAGEVGPYRLATPMSQQTAHTDIGVPAHDLMLDADTSRFFASMRIIAKDCGFKPGDDVLGFFWMPGILFAIGARAPGGTWFSAGYPGSRRLNELLLAGLPQERLRHAFILHKVASPEAMPVLVDYGIDFPGGYQRCGSAVWPFNRQEVVMYRPARTAPGTP